MSCSVDIRYDTGIRYHKEVMTPDVNLTLKLMNAVFMRAPIYAYGTSCQLS